MKNSTTKNTNLRIGLSLVLLAMAGVMFIFLNNRKQQRQDQHLQLITENYNHAYTAIYDQYEKFAGEVSFGLIERYDIISLYQQLLTADAQETDQLRSHLLATMQSRYNILRTRGGVRQLHFHLKNNESFLRFHRPKKYGDNLSGVRATVNYVNTIHLPVGGFEEGKIFNGYRFVFPITAKDSTHLGSMEISFGPETFTSALMKQYDVLSNFLIKDTVVRKKVFQEEIQVHYKKSYIKGYSFDRNVLAALKKQSQQELVSLKLHERTLDKILTNVNSGRGMSLYDPTRDIVITTLPVFNPISHEMVAFLSIRSKSVFFISDARYFRIIFLLSLLLILMGGYTFYALYNKNTILEANADLLEKKSKQLVNAQTIANLGHWELDIPTADLNWSDQIFRIFGFPPQSFEVSREAFMERVHPDDRDSINAAYAGAMEKHILYDVQYRIVTRGGAEKWVRETCSTEYDEAGEPIRSFGIVHDINEQHNSLLLLQQKHEMFMHGPVMIFTWRHQENWPVEYVSENVGDTLGFSADEFLDGSIKYLECIHPDDLQRVRREVLEHSEANNKNFVHEPYRLIARNGESVWVLDSTSVVRGCDGEISHFQGYLVNITQTMLMKDEISEAKKRLELVIDGASLGTWDLNVATGKSVQNNRFAEIIGYAPDEIKSDIPTWQSTIHPDDAPIVNKLLSDHFEGVTSVYKSEHRLRHKSGKWVWVLDVGKVLERDENGKALRVLGILLDITENRDAAETLLKSKQQEYMRHYIRAIDNIGLGLFVIDADYRVRGMNNTMNAWFGYQQGKICYETVAGLDHPCPHCRLGDIIDGGEIVKYDPVIFDGRSLDVVGVPLVNSDGTVRKMAIIRDITEQEKSKTIMLETNSQLEDAIAIAEAMAEKAAEANHAKSVFLSTIGHELRTPLNAILGYTQTFSKDTSLSEKVQMGVRTIQQSGEHLLLLLNDILDLSKIEAKKMELVTAEFRLPEFLQGIMGIILIRAKEKGLDCYFTAETPVPTIIQSDELRLRQVLINLLSNAVKFTKSGHCALCVRSQISENNKVLLTFIIEDSGIGIVAKMQKKIFEPFQQTGQRLKYSEGYGLGLSISYKLVQLMGGNLEIVSPVNEQPGSAKNPGSCFSFSIEVGVSSGELFETSEETLSSIIYHDEFYKIAVPPGEILETLIELAKSGDIDAVREQSSRILQMEHGKYEEFSSRIKQLADKFQLIEIVSFVSKYLRR
jgi:PAS domain S-box-containing protein